MKKIDCISAVNVLSGDPLNFPDLDIANLLLDPQGRVSMSSNPSTAEIGRKSMSLGTPFSSTPSFSSNALQGSDFAAVISDSDYGSFNDHEIPYSHDDDHYQISLRPTRENNNNNDSESMEFQVPDELKRQRRQERKMKRFKNALMDHELMLEKDQLFINEQEMLQYTNTGFNTFINDPLIEALKLLNKPDENFISETFDSIFTSTLNKFEFITKKPKLVGTKSELNKPLNNENDETGMIYDDGGLNDYDVEMYRNETSFSTSTTAATPSNLILPWSASSSSSDKHFSSILNTPIRKAGNSTPSPLTEDLKLTSSSSNTSFTSLSSSIANANTSNSALSQETFDFFYFLVDSIPSKSGSTALNSVLKKESTSRAVAARALHHLLELTSANLINVKQNEPFSDIKITIIQ